MGFGFPLLLIHCPNFMPITEPLLIWFGFMNIGDNPPDL
jgi:hypothetical protein